MGNCSKQRSSTNLLLPLPPEYHLLDWFLLCDCSESPCAPPTPALAEGALLGLPPPGPFPGPPPFPFFFPGLCLFFLACMAKTLLLTSVLFMSSLSSSSWFLLSKTTTMSSLSSSRSSTDLATSSPASSSSSSSTSSSLSLSLLACRRGARRKDPLLFFGLAWASIVSSVGYERGQCCFFCDLGSYHDCQ